MNRAGDAANPGGQVTTLLSWVGRNHGKHALDAQGYDVRRTNFLYVDGHVETKNVKETVEPSFQWGQSFYSLNPGNDIAP